MPITIAFDVYGTLINTKGISKSVEKYVGSAAPTFVDIWRTKQLEYSFRRGLMRSYKNFSICTQNALDYTCTFLQTDLSKYEKNKLLEAYNVLPAFDDVEDSLKRLRNFKDFKIFAFSNGLFDDVKNLLIHANIDNYFDGIISTDEIKSFKPDPKVYEYFLQKANCVSSQTWLISGNPFDVIGAISAGLNAIWVKRSEFDIFDPWEIKPTITIKNLTELYNVLKNRRRD